MNKVVAEVGQYSRESGRVPVHVLHERLESERQKLIGEKQQIEAELSEVSGKKADQLADLYRRRMPRSDVIAATSKIQAEFNNSRAKLIRDKSAIEERLHDIKRRLSAAADLPAEVKVLLRIEKLLDRILDKVSPANGITPKDNG